MLSRASTVASPMALASSVLRVCNAAGSSRALPAGLFRLTPLTGSACEAAPMNVVFRRGFAAPAAGAPKLSGTAKAKLEKEKRMKKRRAKLMLFKTRSGPFFHVDEAIRIVRAAATARFDETVDVQVQLGVDPRKPNQNIRGVAQLPHGTGKTVEIAVFAKGEKAEEARRAGATHVGAEDLVDKIAKGELPLTFNKTIATPDVMPLVGKVARILGPRGLMPNPKLGTVTLNVKDAVAAARKGQAEYRVEKRGIVMAGIGKVSFTPAQLRDNLRSLMLSISDQKPEGVKGAFIRSATIRSTMGPGIPLDLTTADPSSGRFMEPIATTMATAALAAGGPGPAGLAAIAGAAAPTTATRVAMPPPAAVDAAAAAASAAPLA